MTDIIHLQDMPSRVSHTWEEYDNEDGSHALVERITARGDFLHRGTVSIIMATIDRPTLERSLNSIEMYSGDEVLVVRRTPPGRDWGSTEKNIGIPLAKCSWLAFLDDDDYYLPGHRSLWADAMQQTTDGRELPTLFRMRYPSGKILWKEPKLRNGNMGTPMILIPNMPRMLHYFGHRFEGDFDFMNSARWPARWFIWREEVVAELGHD